MRLQASDVARVGCFRRNSEIAPRQLFTFCIRSSVWRDEKQPGGRSVFPSRGEGSRRNNPSFKQAGRKA